MGNWSRIILSFLISIFFITWVAAQEQEGNIVIADSAFVRSGPGDNYVPVGALYTGDRVFPLNKSADSQWVLIPYSSGYGWIRRDLVRWENESQIDQLVPFPADFTPTPLGQTIRPTAINPTATPEGDYANPQGSQSVYVRAGPGRGYLRLGQVLAGENIDAVAQNEDGSWIMIRFSNSPTIEGFGWIGRALAYWEDEDALDDLPVVLTDDLTPTLTFTPSRTPSPRVTMNTDELTATDTAIPTATNTDEPTATDAATNTDEPTATDTATDTATATNTDEPTATDTATATNTDEPTATDIAIPTATDTDEPTATDTPTATNTDEPTATDTATATNTDEPTATDTATATATNTDEPTATDTATATATNTDEPTATDTATATNTDEPTATDTATNTDEPTATDTPFVTDIFAVQATSVAAEATFAPTDEAGIPINPQATLTPSGDEIAPDGSPRLPIEAIVGAIFLILILAYIWFYMQGLGTTGRYSDGFVISQCPVCERGSLHIDERKTRVMGIPMVRRTIRCDECRSVLRETGTRRWRYAVDRIENPVMYDRFNNQELSDDELERLAKQPPKGLNPRTNPQFVDDGQDNQ